MMIIEAKHKKVSIPDQWNELNLKQYLEVIEVIEQLSTGKLSFFDAKLRLLQIASGYKRSKKRYSADNKENINNNLVILAEKMQFAFRPEYPDKEVMDVFTYDLCLELEKKFPFEIVNPHMRAQLDMVGDKLKYRIGLNLDMRSNPIPIIKLPSAYQLPWPSVRGYYGPQFDIDNNLLLTTDLLAEEYIDALSYYRLYHQTRDTNYLNGMVAVLYRQKRANYTTIQAQRHAPDFNKVNDHLKKGVFFFFQSIQEYLLKRSPYKLLYGTPSTSDEKISLGMIDTLYSLSKEGYGSKQQLAKLNLLDFLNLRMKQIIDAVHQLRSSKKKDHEIAESLKIPIETIQQI